MRDPNNINQVELQKRENTLYIQELPQYDIQDYDLFDTKSFKHFMKDLERMVRSSIEYQQFVMYLRENMEMNQCAFYENVSNEDSTKIKIHIHHDPLSLYDICIIVFNKRVAYNEPLEIELIAKEVMFLHYKLLIGLIPLSETVHQLVHNSFLFVPTTKVLGDYKQFVNLYKPYFPPDQTDILDRIEELTYTVQTNLSILERSDLYLEFGGDLKLPSMSNINKILNVDSNEHSSNMIDQIYSSDQFIIPAVIVKKEEK